jgi:hypothetical protein
MLMSSGVEETLTSWEVNRQPHQASKWMDGFVENPNLKWMIETWVPPFQETAIV